MKNIQQLAKIIKMLIKEQDEKIVNLRGVRGYGSSHPIPIKPNPSSVLGYVSNEDENEKDPEPVKISRAFKKVKND